MFMLSFARRIIFLDSNYNSLPSFLETLSSSYLPEKELRIMIVKMIKNLENKMEKMQESINKHLEELKNKHKETTQLLKLKIL